ncbi:MAG: hypothetical protein H0V54_01205 [Chthoniobacterales bacterium]|nr:hypothetical protein [Chthoniobacterales bacterium]
MQSKSKRPVGINALINDALRFSLSHFPGEDAGMSLNKICESLCERRPANFDMEALIARLEQNIEERTRYRGVSDKNWELRRRDAYKDTQLLREEVLERRIIKAMKNAHRDDWFNKCATVSGDLTPRSGCHIDLIRRCSNEEFELIELKVGSDTPVFAAFEILRNALFYLRARRSWIPSYSDRQLLKAKRIALRVLAPLDFYKDEREAEPKMYDLRWFERELDRAISAAGRSECEMTFAFEVFPPWFVWSGGLAAKAADDLLLKAVDEKQALFTE